MYVASGFARVIAGMQPNLASANFNSNKDKSSAEVYIVGNTQTGAYKAETMAYSRQLQTIKTGLK